MIAIAIAEPRWHGNQVHKRLLAKIDFTITFTITVHKNKFRNRGALGMTVPQRAALHLFFCASFPLQGRIMENMARVQECDPPP